MLHICGLISQSLVTYKIKNLIFDLGRVIMDLDFSKTHQAFSALAGVPVEALKGKIHTASFFDEYEKGLMTDSEFRNHMRSFLNSPQAQDQEIDSAWNAMLLTITREHYDLLNALKSKYKTNHN